MENLTLDHQICSERNCLESFALKFTNDVEDANDLVQDTIIKAIRYRDLYTAGTNLRGWLYTIMKNTFINDYRKSSRRASVIQTTEDLSSANLKESAAKNGAENTFLREDLTKALAKVPDTYTVPFLLYFEGYKYEEIAEQLNIPLGTVKTRIHVARQQLKNALKMYAAKFGSERMSA